MTAAVNLQTIEAHPLGKPSDRLRYGMTPSMAIVYADLIRRFGDKPDEPFCADMRGIARRHRAALNQVHSVIAGLCERGWIMHGGRINGWNQYRFVLPITVFPKIPKVWGAR